jgi:hypothetical protein
MSWFINNFFYGRAYSFAPRCAVLGVHSLPRGKERTKKARQRLPPLETASVPLFKEGWGEKHKSLFCISRQFATTSGRH